MTTHSMYTIHADHVSRTDCLAYALANNEFSEEEITKISFDHGDTAKSFPKTYGTENLLSILREELFNSSHDSS